MYFGWGPLHDEVEGGFITTTKNVLTGFFISFLGMLGFPATFVSEKYFAFVCKYVRINDSVSGSKYLASQINIQQLINY